MQFKDWGINQTLENKYHASLHKILRMILTATKTAVTAEEINSALQKIWTSKEFRSLAVNVARKFILQANTDEARTWREASKATMQGKEFYEALTRGMNQNVLNIINQKTLYNAELITKIPYDLSRKITEYVTNETLKGRRAEDIQGDLQGKLHGYSASKIQTIARTEASKATTALTEARARDVGTNWYMWRTANDGNRVRDSHRHMHRVLINWDNPPAPEELIGEKSAGNYHAGEIYNCRCYPQPIISLNEVTWPAKVYYGGRIITMSRSQFEKIRG